MTPPRVPWLFPLLLGLACGEEPERPAAAHSGGGEVPASTHGAAPKPPAPQKEPAPPPLPEPSDAIFTLPIRAPLALIAERIEAELPAHEAQPVRSLTRPGASPALEASYEVWRDPVKLRFGDTTLHVEVPLRYAARFNARVKNPFGGRWLTLARDQPWGTAEHPERVVLQSHTRLEITPDWELKLHTAVDAPEHGALPDGKLCTGGGFKLCVSRATVAPELRRRLDAEILPRMQKAAADVDRRVEQLIDLRARLQAAWALLASPIPLGERHFLRVEPLAAALELRGDADAVVVEPSVSARLSHHAQDPGKTAPPKLPPRSQPSALRGERMALPMELSPAEVRKLLEGFVSGAGR